MPKNSGAIDAAIVQALTSDSELAALMPDGVYFGRAPQGSSQFVVVSLVPGTADAYAFDGYAVETLMYRVEAIALGTNLDAAAAAAVRIDAVLHDRRPADWPISGYKVLRTERSEPIEDGMDDPDNTSVRWADRGGYYRVVVQPDV
jgi:hypothetical protein